jgi:hypothetical protein
MPDNLLMPEGSDPYYGQRYMPGQTLSAYQPTLRDRLATWFMGDQRASPERNRLVEGITGSRGMGTTGLGLIDATPAGIPMGVQDAYRAGDDRSLAMALIPGAPKGVAQEARAATQGIRAYHGSPHDFDRFDISKIGTGEGAQAYGPGLYFAESEGVAKSYKRALGDPTKQMMAPRNEIEKQTQRALSQYVKDLGDGGWDDMVNLRHVIRNEIENDRLPEAASDAFDHMVRDGRLPGTINNGRLYEVRINANPGDFLDWDKPLAQQSEKVRGAFEKAVPDRYKGITSDDEVIAGEHYRNIFHENDNRVYKTAFRRMMNDEGVPGIRYLDQGSRSAGEGSRNYVVFSDQIIDIVRKYGIAAAASMYGMDAVNSAMGAAQDKPHNLLMQGYDQAGY